MTYHVRETCRLCDAKLPDERVLDLGETPLANALVSAHDMGGPDVNGDYEVPYGMRRTYPLYLKQCPSCGHVQLPVVVDPKLLFPADYPYASATGASFCRHLEKMALDLLPQTGDRRPMVVEFGSNDGYLLQQFWRNGCKVIGIDPAGKAASGGILTAPTFFDTGTALAVKTACGPADLIVANNVFAHADDLHEIVEGVKILLAPEGRFVFEVGYLPDVLRTNNFGTVYHEHLSYHSLLPLDNFFRLHGLNLHDAERVETQGGSIRCFVDRSERYGSERMLRMMDWEQSEQLIGWQSRATMTAVGFANQLVSFKTAGKSIAAYGCSAKSTTLLHVAGVGRETIDWIADDNPLKVGKFSPGKHIPIVPGSWLEEKQPDYCVSLSGNFSEAFRAQHPEYRGEWIEPDLMGAR